ncbi:glutamine amidotransferase [Sphingomonas montanisoli]|uniref:Glutamine amidotransferase n=1 Tax=Sphingomonas montanisoli TaxID=2606412 RepID=A0A5D9C4S6_9SPHN|nr:glutamine amidotransferase [Sphingomonas montanisoli]TZG25031.1 glutamine amidotransferase [Sphingomonas montanisoli]
MKSCLVIRHVPYEGVAGFRAPIEAAGYAIDRVDVTDPDFANVDFDAPDLVVMMGGPMGVYDVERHPWISCEITRLARRILLDRPTLGVCLGSQMIAAAMGSRVYPGPVKEVGFSPISINGAGQGSPLRHIEDVPVLHWHGDTFDLPSGVELLASSDKYAHQGFRRGDNLLALQFHSEMGEDPRFDAWLENEDDVTAAGLTVPELRAQHDTHGSTAVAAGRLMIADWLARLA